ncbi:SulP family inorganic anion transporter [Aureivirga sp. CE67]|uniref:SulP family inorganic anion transporter n=1 Tax=Aureivirga sp. CE67 TaxID=1788983 RepID=UPI0018CA0D70|nr:SulP family inorganic anion transporter [Aureivirga sp. CE67]
MTDIMKSILSGIAATPFILMMTIGVSLACGLNPHFLLVSVLITNIFGILFNRNSSDFFNIGVGLVVLMITFQNSIGIESGYLQTFIMFAVPAIIFIILSYLPVNYLLVPNRVISILTFGIGIIVILKQLPNAFAYSSLQTNSSFDGEEKSFLELSTVRNWVQLALALSIPIVALIGHRFKKSIIALFLATFVSLCLGYLLGYETTPFHSEMLLFNEPFQLNWTFSPEILYSSLQNGITVTVVMLMSFWADFSILNHDSKDNKETIKKSFRTVGFGNLISGIFGVMPTNISLIDSFSIRAFGGERWISKLPIIFTLMIIAIVGIPNFNVPIFVFAGVLIYIGILLIIKSWLLLKELHWLDYFFTLAIGLIIVISDYTIGFVLAMFYALVFYLISRWKTKKNMKIIS